MAVKSVETRLFDLFNHNYRFAIKNLTYVVQNRYFLSYDQEILQGGRVGLNYDFAKILKALGYGDPADSDLLYYPTRSTLIPNILKWNPEDPFSCLATLKIMYWMIHRGLTRSGDVTEVGCRVVEAIEEMHEKYALPIDTTRTSLRFAHKWGIIFAESGYRAELSNNETICLSPRGKTLARQIFIDEVLFSMFIDDLCSPAGKRDLLHNRPAVGHVEKALTRQYYLDLIKWVVAFLDHEKNTLNQILYERPESVKETLALLEGRMVTQCIAEAIDLSYVGLLKYITKPADKRRLNEIIRICKDNARFFREQST